MRSPWKRLHWFRRSKHVVVKRGAFATFANDQIQGGIEVEAGATVHITNCIISANASGGGVFPINSAGANPPSYGVLPSPPVSLPLIRRATPFVGFRGWEIDCDPAMGFRLKSSAWVWHWKVGEVNTASCLSPARGSGVPDDEIATHPAPDANCECGLYLMRRLDDLGPYLASNTVKGAVIAWGKVVEHTDGFRAQHARLVGLVNTGPLSEQVGKALGLPVVSRSYMESYVTEFGDVMEAG